MQVKRVATVKIRPALWSYLQGVLDSNTSDPEYDKDGVIDRFTAVFGGGWEADIKVCNGDGPYIDPVLFKDGHEVNVLEVREALLGDYVFRGEGRVFLVRLRKGGPPRKTPRSANGRPAGSEPVNDGSNPSLGTI